MNKKYGKKIIEILYKAARYAICQSCLVSVSVRNLADDDVRKTGFIKWKSEINSPYLFGKWKRFKPFVNGREFRFTAQRTDGCVGRRRCIKNPCTRLHY